MLRTQIVQRIPLVPWSLDHASIVAEAIDSMSWACGWE
jgi:hypothetical protein